MLSSMDANKTTLERAFDLARSGKCLSLPDIAHTLQAEGYLVSQIEGQSLRKQLLVLIEEATKPHAKRP